MKKHLVLFLILSVVGLATRWHYRHNSANQFQVATFDALGYYFYLPAVFIYHDVSKLDWFDPIDQKYHIAGDNRYQIVRQADGRAAFKYLGGVAVMQLPFFALAHVTATQFGYPVDGFSAPYQWAIVVAAFFWGWLGLWILYQEILYFFDEKTAFWTLFLTCLGTNFLQYWAVDSGMSHVYIFALYALIIRLSRIWHLRPTHLGAFWIGLVIGLATISRPTEAIMLFIPLLWKLDGKWIFLKKNKTQIAAVILGGGHRNLAATRLLESRDRQLGI